MAVINRTLDATQQRIILEQLTGLTGTGVSGIIGMVPNPCVLEAGQLAAFGLSGAPTVQLVVNRFIPGAGFTAINIGSANAVPAFGTSGVLVAGMSLPASGSTLNNLLANDVLMFQTGGANTAATGYSFNVVLRPIQDFKKFFGGLV